MKGQVYSLANNMNPPQFQVFECTNPACRLRFPNDLSVRQITTCPHCHAKMEPVGNPYSNFQHAAETSGNFTGKISLLLDNLRSAENVGSILRTADGAGVAHVYCCGTTPIPLHPRVHKASLHAEESIPWSYHPNGLLLAAELISNGSFLVGVESTMASHSLFKTHPEDWRQSDLVLVYGNEISGIDPQILEICQFQLHIPMSGVKSSLNVAVSAGITIYWLLGSFHGYPQ